MENKSKEILNVTAYENKETGDVRLTAMLNMKAGRMARFFGDIGQAIAAGMRPPLVADPGPFPTSEPENPGAKQAEIETMMIQAIFDTLEHATRDYEVRGGHYPKIEEKDREELENLYKLGIIPKRLRELVDGGKGLFPNWHLVVLKHFYKV